MNTNSYFTVEILTSGTLFIQKSAAAAPDATFYYWINSTPNTNRDNYDGSITATTAAQYIKVDNANPPAGTKIILYRAETTGLNETTEADNGASIRIRGTATQKIYGNMASLIGFSETIPPYCFRYMFYSSSIVDASELELPWTTLSQGCFIRLFQGNASLTEPPTLTATTLAVNCYTFMFFACTSLAKTAPITIQTITTTNSFDQMYGNCSSLTKVKLQPFHFDSGRLIGMFRNSGVVEAIIETYDETIPNNAYQHLFRGCTNLTKLTCLAKSFNSNTFADWLLDASTTGTFIKHPDATWTTGNSGIPSGWTVKNMNPQVQSIDFNDTIGVYVKGNQKIIKIYGQNNVVLWEENT